MKRVRRLPTTEAGADISENIRRSFGVPIREEIAVKIVGNPEILRGLRRYRVPGVGTTFYDRADVYHEAVVAGVKFQ